MIKVVKEFQMGPSGRESFVNDLSRDEAARFNLLMADMYGDDAYYDDLTPEEWKDLKNAFNGQMTESKKNNGKKVTESFRQDFYDWYDGLNGYWQAKVDEFIEDEGYPDMITDLSEADMEIIMDEFNPEYFDTDEEDLDEGCKTEASRMDNEFYGGGTVYVGLYGDDCGPYGSLDEFKSALKKANIKILDVSGDEEYGWDMTVKGIAKEIYKLVDGKIPGYNCDDVMEFIEEYSLDPEEFEDHEGDPTDYAWREVADDFDPNDEVYESVSKKTESRRYEIDNYDPRFVYDWYMSLDDRWKDITTKYVKSFGGEDLNYYEDDDFYELIDIISELMAREEAGESKEDLIKPVKLYDPDTGREHKFSVPSDLFDEVVEEDTVKKSNGKWTNKGKDGEHGEFKSKKAADAQRKAMFANGYKESYDSFDDEYSDFGDDGVHIGNTFIEEGEEYEWVDQASDVYYLDFDAWQVWKATSVDSGEDAYFVVDKDTGFIDWGPCGEEEAIEFLRSKVDDYNLDESYSPSNNSIDTLLKINEFDGYRVETYLNELGYDSENTPDLSQIPDDVAKKVVLRIKNDYQNNIDKYGDDAQVPFEAFELLNL